jgi:hypothetical protein
MQKIAKNHPKHEPKNGSRHLPQAAAPTKHAFFSLGGCCSCATHMMKLGNSVWHQELRLKSMSLWTTERICAV